MQRRPKLSPMAEAAVAELNPKRNITRLGVLRVLMKYYGAYIMLCFFGLVYVCIAEMMDRNFQRAIAEAVVILLVLSIGIPLPVYILNDYLWVVDYRRWAEGLRLEPAHFFQKEIKAGLLKPEDIEPHLLMTGPVADGLREEIRQEKNRNVTRIMGPYFAKDKHGNLLNPKKL